MRSKPRFLFDVGVGTIVENWVKAQDFDVLLVRELDPQMPDSEILKLASGENRIVVTMDKDFGELVFNSQKKHRGVLLLRLDAATSAEKLAVVEEVFAKHLDELSGHFCVYKNQTLRIR